MGLYGVKYHRKLQNVVGTLVTFSAAHKCHFFVVPTFWRHLWYNTEQTHGNMGSFCSLKQSGNQLLSLATKYVFYYLFQQNQSNKQNNGKGMQQNPDPGIIVSLPGPSHHHNCITITWTRVLSIEKSTNKLKQFFISAIRVNFFTNLRASKKKNDHVIYSKCVMANKKLSWWSGCSFNFGHFTVCYLFHSYVCIFKLNFWNGRPYVVRDQPTRTFTDCRRSRMC